jgi:hypothetical protein
MKKIILSVVLLAFAVAVQAGDGKCCQAKDTSKPSCCATKTSMEAKSTSCPLTAAKSTSKAKPVKQVALLSPKAASLAGK